MSTVENDNNLNITGAVETPAESRAFNGGSPPRTQQTEGEDLVNIPKMVKAFGKVYPIKRFSMSQIFSSVEYIAPFGFVLQNLMALPRGEKGRFLASSEQLTQIAVTALSISGPSAMGLISVATKEPLEWLEKDEWHPLDGLRILSAVLEKNLDLFTPAAIEEVSTMVGGLTNAVQAFSGSTSMTS